MNIKTSYRSRRPGKGTSRVLLAIATGLIGSQPAMAESQAPPRRVVSINLCSDQLLLALADPSQIAGLSRFSRHAEMSYLAAPAAQFPRLRGTAEEVLKLRPDLVLAGAFSGRATRAVLQAHGIRLETFAPPRSIDEAKTEIERVADLVGHADRGLELVAGIDMAMAQAAKARASRSGITALAMQRRGFASGRDTLLSSVLAASGIANAADALGISSVARAPLEAVLKLKPGLLVLEDLPASRDQATALLHHPAMRRAISPSQVIVLPVAELTCGGPSLPMLIRHLDERMTGIDRTPPTR